MRQSKPERVPGSHAFPRVPAYAWAWLQRSRPVVAEAAERLTGEAPTAAFVEQLRQRAEVDVFTRDVLVGVIADVAFGGRLPQRRPSGVSWDRGLTWWAALIAGSTPAEFESTATRSAEQGRLFGPDAGKEEQREEPRGGATGRAPPHWRASSASASERRMVVAGLRELLASTEGDQVPVVAVRQLLAQLESGGRWSPEGPSQ